MRRAGCLQFEYRSSFLQGTATSTCVLDPCTKTDQTFSAIPRQDILQCAALTLRMHCIDSNCPSDPHCQSACQPGWLVAAAIEGRNAVQHPDVNAALDEMHGWLLAGCFCVMIGDILPLRVQVMTALAVAREALSREGQLEARLSTLAQAASQSGKRMFTLPEARLAPTLQAQRQG